MPRVSSPGIGSRQLSRRALIARSALGAATLTIATPLGVMTPAAARAAAVPYALLTESEARALEALGEVLLPGAMAAGIANYVDSQLAATSPLLMLRYLDWPEPYAPFYQGALAALDGLAQARHGQTFADSTAEQQTALTIAVATGEVDGWDGPPAPLVYFVARSDAVDVVYGTPEGFEKLGVPYMAHILPPTEW